jgi:hypothetical protein
MDQQLNLDTPLAIVQTNDSKVDAATERLKELSDLPVSQHADVFEDVHRRLQETLSISSSQ